MNSAMQESNSPIRRISTWLKVALFAVVVEKIIQHVTVTLAFVFNWRDIAATVVVSPTLLIVGGAIVALLFVLALWGLLSGKPWTAALLTGLALFDLIGEFVAQGRLGIHITISFLMAIVLLVLSLVYRSDLKGQASQ
jgi:hypothetical protein